MKKRIALFFLFIFVFQMTVFAVAVPAPASESKLKKAGRKTAGFMQEAARSVLDFTYVVMRKLDLAG